jgi:hypothetical protein
MRTGEQDPKSSWSLAVAPPANDPLACAAPVRDLHGMSGSRSAGQRPPPATGREWMRRMSGSTFEWDCSAMGKTVPAPIETLLSESRFVYIPDTSKACSGTGDGR